MKKKHPWTLHDGTTMIPVEVKHLKAGRRVQYRKKQLDTHCYVGRCDRIDWREVAEWRWKI